MTDPTIETADLPDPVEQFDLDRILNELDLPDFSFDLPPAPAAEPPEPVAPDRPEIPALTPESKPAEAPAGPRIERRRFSASKRHTYKYAVSNNTNVPMRNVRVEHELPPRTRCVGVKPDALLSGNLLAWTREAILPGERYSFFVMVEALVPGEPFSTDLATFRVSHTTDFVVRKPVLALTADGPDAIHLRESGEWRLQVRNTGSAVASGVELVVRRGPGLAGPDGEADSRVELGTLDVGEQVTVTIGGEGVAAGRSPIQITVTAAGAPDITAEHTVQVTAARLTADWSGPAAWTLGATGETTLILRNEGTAAARGLAGVWTVPAGLEVVECPPDVDYPPPGDALGVMLDRLTPGEERRFAIRLRATRPGDWDGSFEVSAAGLAPVRGHFSVPVNFDPAAPAGPLAALAAELDSTFAVVPQAPAVPASPVATGERSVVFTLGPTRYALPLGSVVEIGPPLPTTPVPRVPAWIVGVANCRGEIVSVVNLHAFAGRAGDPVPARRLLLVRDPEGSGLSAGFLADHVTGIQSLPAARTPVAEVRAKDPLAAVATGIAQTDSGLVVVLNPGALLAATAAGRTAAG